MRVLFTGTPATAIPALKAIAGSPHEIVGVLTRADARSGRGRTTSPSPVKAWALDNELPVYTDRPRDEGFLDLLAELNADVAAVVAYGEILPEPVIEAIPNGWINLHFSLLPAWRGAAPVQHAIIAGDEVTGATTFAIESGLDTGPTIGVATETIRPTDTAGELLDRLAINGAQLLLASLDAIEMNKAVLVPQPLDGVSYAPKLDTSGAQVNWDRPALAIDRHIRGHSPDPGAWTLLPDGTRLRIGPVRLTQTDAILEPGQLLVGKREVLVGTRSEPVLLGEVRPPGKKPMPAADWARGARLPEDATFTNADQETT